MSKTDFNKNREIQLGVNQSIVFKFSADLKLEYVNDFFTEFTGYEIHDVVGTSVEEMKHPEIPELISNILYKCVNDKKNIKLILKNATKDGKYYWFSTDFKYNVDKNGNLQSFVFYRNSPPRTALPALEKLYKKLVDIEKHASVAVAEKYLDGLLEDKNMTFEEYTAELSKEETFKSIIDQSIFPQKKKSFFGKLMGK
jgi:PAS domain S-box-containing protein